MNYLINDVQREVYQRKAFAPYKGLIRRAVPFTLDAKATTLVTELATQAEKAGLYRTLARLPYEVVWIEYDYLAKVHTQIRLGTRTDPYENSSEPEKMGYLLERLTETRWRSTSFVQMRIHEKNKSVYRVLDRSKMETGDLITETMPPSFILDTEGKVTGYKTGVRDAALHHAVQAMIDHDDEHCAIAWGLGMQTDGGVFALNPELHKTVAIDLPPDWEAMMARHEARPHLRRDLLQAVMPATMREQAGCMRWLCAALASITSAPTILTERKKQGTFRADGRLREYKVNNVVTLHVPGKKTITVKHLLSAFKGAKRAMARHQVHGFWRTTTATDCPGDRWQWLYSQRHGQMRWHIWINDFERGDATLGYVLRSYEVTK